MAAPGPAAMNASKKRGQSPNAPQPPTKMSKFAPGAAPVSQVTPATMAADQLSASLASALPNMLAAVVDIATLSAKRDSAEQRWHMKEEDGEKATAMFARFPALQQQKAKAAINAKQDMAKIDAQLAEHRRSQDSAIAAFTTALSSMASQKQDSNVNSKNEEINGRLTRLENKFESAKHEDISGRLTRLETRFESFSTRMKGDVEQLYSRVNTANNHLKDLKARGDEVALEAPFQPKALERQEFEDLKKRLDDLPSQKDFESYKNLINSLKDSLKSKSEYLSKVENQLADLQKAKTEMSSVPATVSTLESKVTKLEDDVGATTKKVDAHESILWHTNADGEKRNLSQRLERISDTLWGEENGQENAAPGVLDLVSDISHRVDGHNEALGKLEDQMGTLESRVDTPQAEDTGTNHSPYPRPAQLPPDSLSSLQNRLTKLEGRTQTIQDGMDNMVDDDYFDSTIRDMVASLDKKVGDGIAHASSYVKEETARFDEMCRNMSHVMATTEFDLKSLKEQVDKIASDYERLAREQKDLSQRNETANGTPTLGGLRESLADLTKTFGDRLTRQEISCSTVLSNLDSKVKVIGGQYDSLVGAFRAFETRYQNITTENLHRQIVNHVQRQYDSVSRAELVAWGQRLKNTSTSVDEMHNQINDLRNLTSTIATLNKITIPKMQGSIESLEKISASAEGKTVDGNATGNPASDPDEHISSLQYFLERLEDNMQKLSGLVKALYEDKGWAMPDMSRLSKIPTTSDQ